MSCMHLLIYIYILILKQLDVRLRRTAFRAARAMRCARGATLSSAIQAHCCEHIGYALSWLCAILAMRNCAGLSAPPRRKPGAQPLYIDKK